MYDFEQVVAKNNVTLVMFVNVLHTDIRYQEFKHFAESTSSQPQLLAAVVGITTSKYETAYKSLLTLETRLSVNMAVRRGRFFGKRSKLKLFYDFYLSHSTLHPTYSFINVIHFYPSVNVRLQETHVHNYIHLHMYFIATQKILESYCHIIIVFSSLSQ